MANPELSSSGVPPTTASLIEASNAMPEAFQTPTRRVSGLYITILTLANMAAYITFIPILSIILPLQIQGLDAANKITLLGLTTGLGSAVALVFNPIFGALSDRTSSRFGRRRPWFLAGVLLTTLSFLILMSATTIVVLIAGYLLSSIGVNLILAPLSAILPDQVPEPQRGSVAGLLGLGLPVASIIGAVVIGARIQDTTIRYITLIGIVLVILLPFALFLPDKRLPKGFLPSFQLGAFLKSFWVSPRRFPDFGLVWLARLVSFLGYFIATGYLLYYLQDAVGYERIYHQPIATGVAEATIIAVLTLVISTVLCGILSDRFQRRKLFVAGASVLTGIGLLILAFFPTWTGVLIAEGVLGFGVGAYLSVDLALVTAVLPSSRDRGKDMGIINIASTLPQSLAPLVAAPILNLTHSYLVLFVLGAIITLVGVVAIQPIKGVR